MKRVEKYYIVENQAGEPCVSANGELMHALKKSAEREASRNRRLYDERYTVATFVREHQLPKRATGDAAARATDRLIGRFDQQAINSAFAKIEARAERARARVQAAVRDKSAGKASPKSKRSKRSGALMRGW